MDQTEYLTNFILDNKLNINKIPKNDELYKHIEINKKKRVLVELHYLSNKNNKHKKKIYTFIDKKVSDNLESKDFFDIFEEYPLNKLLKLLQECK